MKEEALWLSDTRYPWMRRRPQWSKLAARHLAAYPYCAACGSRTHLAVHHVVPVHVDESKELDESNLITLCEGNTINCHLWIGHLGHWLSWNEFVWFDAANFLRRIKDRPSWRGSHGNLSCRDRMQLPPD